MRTTLTLDDQLAKELKAIARRTGKPFKDVVDETLRGGLQRKGPDAASRPYRIKTVSLGGVLGGLNIDKALGLAEAIEDEEIARKLTMRK